MATQLAIGYRIAGRPRGPAAPASAAHVSEHDEMHARPAIPQAVVAWTDDDLLETRLPAGAGDPATAIPGPPPFLALRFAPRGSAWKPRRLDGVLSAALGVLLLGLAGVAAWQFDEPATSWVARDTADVTFALAGRVPVVEVRMLEPTPVEARTVVAKR